MKKIFFFMGMVIMFWTHFNVVEAKAYDYKDGWFDRHPNDYQIISGNKNLFDNNIGGGGVTLTGSSRVIVEINKPLKIDATAFFASGSMIGGYPLYIELYENGRIVRTLTRNSASDPEYMIFEKTTLDRIEMRSMGSYGWTVKEIEVFGEERKDPVTNLSANTGVDTVDITFNLPDRALHASINLDGKEVGQTKEGKYQIKNLSSETEYEITVFAVYADGKSVPQTIKVQTTKIPGIDNALISIKDIMETAATVQFDVGKMQVKPKKIDIYKDKENKENVASISVSNQSIVSSTIKDLQSDTDYTFYVKYTFNGDVALNTTIKFRTLTPNREVSNLVASSTAVEVNLKWKMPDYQNLDVARIYRQKNDAGMFAKMFRSASTYEPIFETNGTSFKDLTVKADTEYTYKVTTVDTSDNETEGKTVKTRTKKMSVSGGGTEKDENGDYVITWTSPTTGKIKVLVGGKQYAIVSASDKKIVIPKSKMVFDIIGNPDVQLIPIDDDGNEGIPSKPGGNGTGNGGGIGDIVGGGDLAEVLNPENTIKNGVQLLAVVGAFVLLGLAFRVVPKLVKMIRDAFSNKKDERIYSGRRRVEE